MNSEAEYYELMEEMYGQNEDATLSTPVDVVLKTPSSRTSKVVINGVSVEIVNLSYLEALEKTLLQQSHDLKKLTSILNTFQSHSKTRLNEINQNFQKIQKQLDRKIEARDDYE